jgi:hypothetical protein
LCTYQRIEILSALLLKLLHKCDTHHRLYLLKSVAH